MFIPSITTGGLTETVIWITGGSTWDVPANWNPADNTIECIGGGGGGGRSAQAGAGGHYAKISNVDVSGTINVNVGSGGPHQTDGGDTWFGGSDAASALVLAHGGRGGKGSSNVTTANYDASNSRGDEVFVGGDGGSFPANAIGMPGGGGAAGPLGPGGAGGSAPVVSFGLSGNGGGGANNGADGQTAPTAYQPGVGGDSGTGGNGGTLETVAGDGGGGVGGKPFSSGVVGRGGNGRIWQRTANGALGGPGGGGGGSAIASSSLPGGAGGRFGGGGGSGTGVDSGGVGGDGVICITYRHT